MSNKSSTKFQWGTIVTNLPLAVKFDGNTEPIDARPDTLVDPTSLWIGDRVWCQLEGRRVIIIGAAKGGTYAGVSSEGLVPPAPVAPVLTLLVTGIAVEWSGLWEDGVEAPLDLQRIDVVILTNVNDDPLTVRPSASIVSKDWGGVTINLPLGTYTAVLVAWTFSGEHSVSELSNTVKVINIPLGDGIKPTLPPIVKATSGIGDTAFLQMSGPENPDPILGYEVHISKTMGFTPDASTLFAQRAPELSVLSEVGS